MWSLFASIHMQNLPKIKLVNLESDRTLIMITHLASRESYMVINIPNSHTKFTKSEIRSGWSRLKIIHPAPKKSYLVIICRNSHDKLTKIKLGWSRFEFVQNHSSWSRFKHWSESFV